MHLQEIGEEVYTVPEVVHESCDRATRQRLQVLPYTLHFKKPSAEAIVFGKSVDAWRDLTYWGPDAVLYHLDHPKLVQGAVKIYAGLQIKLLYT